MVNVIEWQYLNINMNLMLIYIIIVITMIDAIVYTNNNDSTSGRVKSLPKLCRFSTMERYTFAWFVLIIYVHIHIQ